MGLGPKGHPTFVEGEDLRQARSVSPHVRAAAWPVRFHPLFLLNRHIVWIIFFVEKLLGIFILPFFPFFI